MYESIFFENLESKKKKILGADPEFSDTITENVEVWRQARGGASCAPWLKARLLLGVTGADGLAGDG